MKITDALVAEHRIYLTVFDQIERVLPSLTSMAEVRTMASIAEGMLLGHAARETNLAYLALDHVLADRGQLERMTQEHTEIDARLRKISTANSCAEGRRLLQAALQTTREHFRLEERAIFPLLERTLGHDALVDLGRPWLDRNAELFGATKV